MQERVKASAVLYNAKLSYDHYPTESIFNVP